MRRFARVLSGINASIGLGIVAFCFFSSARYNSSASVLYDRSMPIPELKGILKDQDITANLSWKILGLGGILITTLSAVADLGLRIQKK